MNLNELRPGGIVLYTSRKGEKFKTFERLEEVHRLTPKTLVTKHGRYLLENGRKIGGIHGEGVEPATPTDITRILNRDAEVKRQSEANDAIRKEQADEITKLNALFTDRVCAIYIERQSEGAFDVTFHNLNESDIKDMARALEKVWGKYCRYPKESSPTVSGTTARPQPPPSPSSTPRARPGQPTSTQARPNPKSSSRRRPGSTATTYANRMRSGCSKATSTSASADTNSSTTAYSASSTASATTAGSSRSGAKAMPNLKD